MSNNIQLSYKEDLAILTFDREGSSANIFDRDTLDELSGHLDTIEAHSSLTGLMLRSAKEKIFIAGADISQFIQITDPQEVRDLARKGQETFARIGDLPFPSVAAIHGQALGGGCEIALACDYRLASPDKVTKIGLPEINLGILPAWGGSVRLPKLIGLPKALDIILAGKTVPAYPAWKRGMIDQLCPREHFERIARIWIGKGKARPKGDWKTSNALAKGLIASKVKPMLQKKTHGHYPAPFKALEVCLQAVSKPREAGFKLEQDALAELMQTDVCQNLVKIFFLQERAKKFKIDETEVPPVEKIAVIGAGVMGAGIAQWNATRGTSVILKDINAEQVNKGMASAGKILGAALKRRIFTKAEAQAAFDRITPATEDVSFKKVDLVIEAATENMDLKKKIFVGLDAQSGEDTLLATNTSALSISEIAETLSDPSRMIGIHYFNPVHKMQLVELVLGKQTSPTHAQRALSFIQKSGKLPVVVQDSPGFLVNRVLMPYLMEAGRMVEAGADVEKIDQCILNFGMPMGPLRLIDEVGIDVSHHVSNFFSSTFGERMPEVKGLQKLLEAGMLGRKSGKGFYLYSKDKKSSPRPNPDASSLIRTSGDKFTIDYETGVKESLVALMINEAAMCLEEGVVHAPEDVDFGMIFGTGFAPFRGGPMRYADTWGASNVVATLEHMEGVKISELLLTHAKDDTTFYPTKDAS